ncbi:metallophosphoesterase [Methylobacterium sp. 4-46]|uniref:LamG-like jellyroll fold domain-containing protein n=1 Tax=unclassified Methylobacterium TaxID=2615210 RepID=UPI000165C6E2|nr:MULTISPECIES: LamG-like jellyroll fold domain-containing protein [Methylobacterium]ACA16189.1 metallophosphoesterase [Methylobacterium sp. 4-46]WFT81897.1 metallophosphoesterase [Methylobacterium nodulans]
MATTNPANDADQTTDWMLRIPKADRDQGLLVTPGGSGKATAYSLVYDVYVPAATAGGWLPFLQTDPDNAGDADLFGKIADGSYGVGIASDYKGEAKLDAWNRVAFTVEIVDGKVTLNKYVNGEWVGSQKSDEADRYTIDKAKGFLIFSDEDGETSPAYLSNFAYAEKALTPAEIAGLGGANREGVFSGALRTAVRAANGSEFRFAENSLAPEFGDVTLTSRNLSAPVVTADQAGIPPAPPPDWIMTVPAGARSQKLHLKPGGSGTATSYSIAFDVYVAAADATSGWIPFLQTDPANGNDADLFGKVSGDHYGIGIGGDYAGSAKLDAWNRIAFTVETRNNEVVISKYINGEQVGVQTVSDAARYAFDKAAGVLIFSDEDGESSRVHVSNVAFIEAPLSDAQVKALGGPSAAGIVPPSLEQTFTGANGSEFRFAAQSPLAATLGKGVIEAENADLVVETTGAAGLPAVAPAPTGPTAPKPVQLRAIKDMMVTPDAGTLTVDLDQYFTASGLRDFKATSSDGKVLASRLDGRKLLLDVGALGFSDVHVQAADAEGKVYTDDFRVRVAGPRAYTIVAVPDTQDYAYPGERRKTFDGMTQWVADNAKALNIRFVTQTGDITNDNRADQWTVAKEAMARLNGVVPYSTQPGNHDLTGNAKDYKSLQSQYFSIDYMRQNSTLGGVYDQEPGETQNAWYTFEGADGTKWIALSLEFGPRDDVLRWAGEVLDAHPDYRAILTTHHYTNMGTRADNLSGPLFGEGTGKDYGTGKSPENPNNGEDMWQKLVSKHTNISFVFSGHVFGDGAETIVSYNDAGQPVYQMLVNYQDGVSTEITGNGNPARGGNGGNGAFRLITIDPDNNRVDTETYLSAFDEYLTGSRGDPEPSRNGKGGAPAPGGGAIQPVTFGRDIVGDGPSGVIAVPRFNPLNGLKVTPGFAPSDGGSTFGAYTLIYDLKLPAEGHLSSLFQGDLDNLTDGDLWLNFRDGYALIGTGGHDEGRVPLDKWTRLAITVERAGAGYTMGKYVDGVLQATQTVGSPYDIGASGFLIFADDSSETIAASLSSFAFIEKALSGDEVAALGGPSAAGPLRAPLAGVNAVQFDFTDGTFAPTIGHGSMSQTIGSNAGGPQLTGAFREQQETLANTDLSAPKVQFVAHAGADQTVSAGPATRASVRLDGSGSTDPQHQIARSDWLNADGEVIAAGAVANVELGAGVHRLTLRATGANGTTSLDQATVAVVDARTLLQEDFNDGKAEGWAAPSERWQVAGSVASRRQSVPGIAPPEGALRASKDASGIMTWTGEGSQDWSGYTVSATLKAEDDKALGLVAYYKDPNTYYAVTFDNAKNQRLLVKRSAGAETVLARESGPSPYDRPFRVALAVEGGKLLATLDGEALFGGAVADASAPLAGGTVGLFTEGQRGVVFDDVFVEKGVLVADAGKAQRVIDRDGDAVAAVDLSGRTSFGVADGARAQWSENGKVLASDLDARLALGTGAHLLRLDLDGPSGRTSDTVRVEVVAARDLLLDEDFSAGARNFRFVDEGEIGKAAAWSVSDGVLRQASDRYSRELGGSGDTAPSAQWKLNWSPLGDGVHALRKGTYAVYDGPGASEWKDYSVETDFTAARGGVGLLLHYQDDKNYYKIELDDTTGLAQLFSLKNGIEQTLWQGPIRYDAAGPNHLRADIVDGKLQVWLDGTALFTQPVAIHDTEKGTFALYNWHGGGGVTYDNVRAVALGTGEAPVGKTLVGGAGDDALTGGAGADSIMGGGGNDTLSGLAGNDVLAGEQGDDQLIGGDGDDSLDGGDGADLLCGNDGADGLWGGAGKDQLYGGAGADTLDGGDGADTLFGNEGADWMAGQAGDDALVGGDGSDSLFGGAGNDWLVGEAGDDALVAGEGSDSLFGGDGADWLAGEAGDDALVGGEGTDSLFGGDGNDWLVGEGGDDLLIGGEGNDSLFGGAGADWLEGQAGDDALVGGEGDDVLRGGEGNDWLDGEAGNDVLVGGAGNDGLRGGDGADWLVGEAGSDTLSGGAGDDVLFGGAGSDTIQYASGDGRDVVRDFVTGGAERDVVAFGPGLFGSFAAVQAATQQVGADVVITASAGNTLTLQNVQASSLSAENFTFA